MYVSLELLPNTYEILIVMKVFTILMIYNNRIDAMIL